MPQTKYHQSMALAIIKHQEAIIGSLSWSQANRVPGLKAVDNKVTISGDGKVVLEDLVKQYETLFGRASVEACKDAIRPLLSKIDGQDLPEILS